MTIAEGHIKEILGAPRKETSEINKLAAKIALDARARLDTYAKAIGGSTELFYRGEKRDPLIFCLFDNGYGYGNFGELKQSDGKWYIQIPGSPVVCDSIAEDGWLKIPHFRVPRFLVPTNFVYELTKLNPAYADIFEVDLTSEQVVGSTLVFNDRFAVLKDRRAEVLGKENGGMHVRIHSGPDILLKLEPGKNWPGCTNVLGVGKANGS